MVSSSIKQATLENCQEPQIVKRCDLRDCFVYSEAEILLLMSVYLERSHLSSFVLVKGHYSLTGVEGVKTTVASMKLTINCQYTCNIHTIKKNLYKCKVDLHL